MNDRDAIARELDALVRDQKELEILYEQYFAGIEKREPVKVRESQAIRLRRFSSRRIMQTDLRFKYQNLATRFHSYAGYWDRILRLMDEGRYARHLHQAPDFPDPPALPPAEVAPPDGLTAVEEIDAIYRQLLAARRTENTEFAVPDRQQLAAFLERQKEKIREKFGTQAVEFRVVTEDGRAKIKVRAKR